MNKPYVLKFSSLSDLALFLKMTRPKGYTLNTVLLTLTASLTPFELSIAVENYHAEELKKIPV